MQTSEKLNRQLFLFIACFVAFAYLLGQVADFPAVAAVLGSTQEEEQDEWDYAKRLAVWDELSWSKSTGHATVPRDEAVFWFYGAEGREGQVDSYLDELQRDGFQADDLNGDMTRGELYRLVLRLLDEPLADQGEVYFLGGGEGLPLDALARLGVVELPHDRVFRPAETVTRDELVRVSARALWPELRVDHAPVVVQPKVGYTYSMMEADLKRLAAAYPERITLDVIGESVEGRKIYTARLGRGETDIFIDASIHGNEWLNTSLLMKMLEEYAHHARAGIPFGEYDVAGLLENVSIWFIPMLNPDGVTLVLEGPGAVAHAALVKELRQGAGHFRDWKSNIRGVDLNRQFPTGWREMVNPVRRPGPAYYKGKEPLSEPEARALYDFTLARRPAMVLSYHQQGEVIFWYYRQKGEQLARDRRIVQRMARLTGYRWEIYLANGGKYKDWAVRELGIPALIMETGRSKGDLNAWNRIWQQNRFVGLEAAKLMLAEKER